MSKLTLLIRRKLFNAVQFRLLAIYDMSKIEKNQKTKTSIRYFRKSLVQMIKEKKIKNFT
jgi:hypothetical protein